MTRAAWAARRACCAALLLLSRGAAAQDAGEPAPALSPVEQALFEQAVKLMDAGSFAEACPKLKEVVRLYPSGVGGRLRLAECHAGEGKLASAWAAYRSAESAAALAGQTGREQKAREQAAALAPRLSHLTVVVPASLAGVLELKVRLDDREVGPAEWRIPVPVDGGRHALHASARGKAPWQAEIEVAPEAANASVTVELVDAPAARTEAPSSPTSPPPPAGGSSRSAVPAGIWATGGTGLAALIAGVALRIDVQGIHAAQEARCKGDIQHCARADPRYDPSADNARKNLEFGLFVGLVASGALAAGTSLVGLVVVRSRAPQAPRPSRIDLVPWVAGRSRGGMVRVSF